MLHSVMKTREKREEERCPRAQLPPGLELMLVGLCADYFRREEVLRAGSVGFRLRMEYAYLNARIHDAARELCEDEGEARLFIREIGEKRGYAGSETLLSESVYKQRKREIRYAILRKLHLFEEENFSN